MLHLRGGAGFLMSGSYYQGPEAFATQIVCSGHCPFGSGKAGGLTAPFASSLQSR